MMNSRIHYLIASFLFLLASRVSAEINFVDVNELLANDFHKESTQIITKVLGTYHYKNRELDDALSADILDKFIENLDNNRSFFLSSDIEAFKQKYKFKLDDSIKSGNLQPAFEIFKTFRQRVITRVDTAIGLLNTEFDFTVDEDYQFDRRDDAWPGSAEAMDEIWRKRVKNDLLNLKLSKKEQKEIKETLLKRYQRIKTSTLQFKANDVFQSFINAYTTSIEPHTSYFSPRTSENFDISMRLSLEGIGAVLRAENDYTQVQRVITGGPADLSGEIDSEDYIIGVGQGVDGSIVDVVGWRLDDVVDLIRGKKGTALRLEILPNETGQDGPSKIISLVRDQIKLEEQAAQSSIIELPGSETRIGVIELPTFYVDFNALSKGEKNYKSTSRDVRSLLKDMTQQGIDGLVMDLRGNGGGSLAEALELTGLFIEQGPIVQTRNAKGRVDINKDPDPSIFYAGPLAVLVDRNSASASEIFAGAIQDYHRGIIIGEPTFGKGTVQNIVDLNRYARKSDRDLGKLKTTIAQFYRVSGGSNQHKGVIPDIVLPTAIDSDEQGERSYKNAIPWDKVKKAHFTPASAPIESFKQAQIMHKKRIESDKLFSLLMKEIKLVRENTDKKVISLMESKRRKQRDELEKTKKQLESEFQVAQGLSSLEQQNSNEDKDLKKEQNDDSDDDPSKDIILMETSRILNDLIVPAGTETKSASDLKTVTTERFENNKHL